MKIGIAGTGRLGSAIAQRLLDLHHDVTVWNRTAQKVGPLAALGAKVATTPAALASASDLILSVLTNAAAIDAAYLGERGLLAGAVQGKLFVEMSTVRPKTERDLGEKVRARGASLIDCPVSGSVGPALSGKLLGFVGGDAVDLARARSVLEQLCRRIEHVGPVGAGASLKLAINLPLLVYWQALGEALALCAPLDVEPARLVDIFADTAGGPNLLKGRGGAIADALAGRDIGATTFDVDSIRKDLRTMIEEARSLGCASPVAERVLECFDQAASAGLGARDGVMLPARWARRAHPAAGGTSESEPFARGGGTTS